MNIERLEKLAAFLDPMARDRFNFRFYVDSFDEVKKCGTVCCAIGWLPDVDPSEWKWEASGSAGPVPLHVKSGLDGFFGASVYFDIDSLDASRLFDPMTSRLGDNATPQQVSAHIRAFIAKNTPTERTP